MSEFSELITGLPEELALECLTRLHYATHRVATRVCKTWRKLLQSREFYYHRKQAGHTHKVACLIQSLPVPPGSDASKASGPVSYGASVFDSVCGTWDWLDPIPKYPHRLPLFCQVTSSDGKLVVMGGWDPETYKPVKDVFVYQFTTRQWRRVKDMPETRSFFAAGELNGLVIVAGGHDDNKNALSSAWMYDVEEDEWTELGRMSQDRDECEGVVIGSEFWVVGGYKTESQGEFEGSADVYELGTGKWRRVEDAWKASHSPRSCVGVKKDGKLFSWAESDSAVQVGACAVDLGDRILVSGSGYQGGRQGFFLVEGEGGKLKRMDVDNEFSGVVQSVCRVEI